MTCSATQIYFPLWFFLSCSSHCDRPARPLWLWYMPWEGFPLIFCMQNLSGFELNLDSDLRSSWKATYPVMLQLPAKMKIEAELVFFSSSFLSTILIFAFGMIIFWLKESVQILSNGWLWWSILPRWNILGSRIFRVTLHDPTPLLFTSMSHKNRHLTSE